MATVMEYPQDLMVQQLLGQFTNQSNRSGSDKIFPTENSTDLMWGLGEAELKKVYFSKRLTAPEVLRPDWKNSN